MSGPRTSRSGLRTIAAAAIVTLVGLSWVGVALAALFLDLTTKQGILAVAAAILVTEVALYVGAVFLGGRSGAFSPASPVAAVAERLFFSASNKSMICALGASGATVISLPSTFCCTVVRKEMSLERVSSSLSFLLFLPFEYLSRRSSTKLTFDFDSLSFVAVLS